MARYAVASNNWNNTATWSATDGGAPGASVPTAADDVFLTALSGAIVVTLTATASCRSLNCTGFTGTLTGSFVIQIGDATAGAGNIALKLVSGMTNSAGTSYTFMSTSGTQQTIDFSTKQASSITWSGAGSNYLLISQAFSNNSVNHTAGTLNINGQTCNFTAFASSGSTARTLTMGASSFTSRTFNFTLSGSNLTFNADTSTIIMTASGRTWANEGYTFYNVTLSGTGVQSFTGTCTINVLTISGVGATMRITSGKTITLLSTPVMSGTAGNLKSIDSTVAGSPGTLSKASGTISLDYLNIKDNTATGGATWNPGSNSVNQGGNTGWLFTTTVKLIASITQQSVKKIVGAILLDAKKISSIVNA